MATDPVCGMFVDETSAELKAEVRGTICYFCSESCLREFLAPEKELRRLKFELLFAALLSVPILLLTYVPLLPTQTSHYLLFLLETPVQFVVGWRFYEGTYDSLKNRMGNMDVLIALGTSTAWAYSAAVTFAPGFFPISGVYFDTSVVIITLILAGRYLEHITKSRATAAVRKLAKVQPTVAHRLDDDGRETDTGIERISVGDVLMVRPGERIPVDAEVLEGSSVVDESMITGESGPVDRSASQEVIGGTINLSGLLKLRAEKVGKDTTLSRIIRLVEEAQAGAAPIQRLADRVASYFVPVVIAVAVLAAVSWFYLGHIGLAFSVLVFVSVVVISCPCALGVATPAALLVGSSKGAQNGVLIKDGRYLELAAKADTVVFDKTGTLTVGKLSVTDVVSVGRLTADELLLLAASAERGSEHPMARAIVDEARARSRIDKMPEPLRFQAFAGLGISAVADGRRLLVGSRRFVVERGCDISPIQAKLTGLEESGKTCAIVARDGVVEGVIALGDSVKPSARPTMGSLRRLGMDILMMTGDNQRAAGAVARELGIERYLAELLPAEKLECIDALQKEGRVVAMVGDGINDAPALARADVGIAIGSGTDVAKETGGIILITDDLRNVATSIELSRKTLSKIRQNLFWAFAYNVILIPIAAGALVPLFGAHVYTLLPFLAAAAMAVSSVTVIANSLLLFRFRPAP